MRIHGKPYSGNYRRNWRRYNQTAEWVMNDETALVLRKLKDADGNYIWNHNTDTIFGKSVFISDFMPNVNNGNKPIAFGDFSYYWIVNRSGILVRTLAEKFALSQQTGYLACEYLDARPDLAEKNILNPSEAIEYFVLSRRKFYDLLNNTDGEDFLAYYRERKLILRVAFERYLCNHPELRRRI